MWLHVHLYGLRKSILYTVSKSLSIEPRDFKADDDLYCRAKWRVLREQTCKTCILWDRNIDIETHRWGVKKSTGVPREIVEIMQLKVEIFVKRKTIAYFVSLFYNAMV